MIGLRNAALLFLVGLCSVALGAQTDAQIQAVYSDIVKRVSLDNLQQTYRDITAFGSRLTGSEAEKKTFDYVRSRFQSLGLTNIRLEPFDVTIPDPKSTATLRVGGKQTTLLPLWPNVVRTSTCDVTGKLVYGGDGRFEALDGKEIEGNIVLLEFRSGSRWRNAAKLGAAAIVFIEPTEMDRGEAEQKMAAVALNVPRFYLSLKDAIPILNAAFRGQRANLKCRQDWVVAKSGNLLADLPGADTTATAERILVSANADSMSILPGLAPGAESIGGIAALLELVRITKDTGHRRPITFCLSGAKGLALQGAREFVEKRIREPEAPWLLNLDLDLTSGNSTIAGYGRGWFYEYRNETKIQVEGISRMFRRHADRLAPVLGVPSPRLVYTDAVNDSDNRTWKNNIPGKFAMNCEVFNLAACNGLTLATIEDSRDRSDTPFDTLDKVNVSNVWRQTRTIAALSHHVFNDDSSPRETSDYRVQLEPKTPQRMTLIGGFTAATGKVVIYDPQQSFVPDVKVPGALVTIDGSQKTFMGVRGIMVQKTGEDARFRFFGIASKSAFWAKPDYGVLLNAYHLDAATGDITIGPDSGPNGYETYPSFFEPKTGVHESPLVVFPCVATNLFDLIDPHELKQVGGWNVKEGNSDAEPRSYGLLYSLSDMRLSSEVEDTGILLATPGARLKLLLRGGQLGGTKLILSNSSRGNEAGSGYGVRGGKSPLPDDRGSIKGTTFKYMPLNTAKDIASINATRIERFRKYRIISQSIDDLQKLSEDSIAAADKAIAEKRWSDAERHSRAAWGYALRAHPVIQQTASDVVNGVVFYLFLIIPFSYFMERLLVGHRSLTRQLAVAGGIFLSAFVLLRLIHPAFEIVTNPTMIFVGFVMGALSLIVMMFILGKFEQSLKQIKAEQSGLHEVDIRRMSVAMAAFNLGVSNMRRRKARTVLTTLTLVVMTFIVLSFTSIVSDLKLQETPSPTEPRYTGMLVRNPGLEPMPNSTYRQLANEFAPSGNVVRRAYYYGADIGDNGVLTLQRGDRNVEVRAMLGLDPGETAVSRPQEALVPGGRWFRPGESDAMLLPTPLAEALKIDAKEVGRAKVSFAGRLYTVIGLLDPAALRGISDLDGDGLLPADFSLSRLYQSDQGTANEAFRSFVRLDPAVCFILPADTAMNLGGDIRSLGVSYQDPKATRAALVKLMPRFKLNLYASVLKDEKSGSNDLEVRQFSAQQGSKSTGLGLVIIQLIIASVFVLNTMVATVFERTKEISIFSAIGLAPNHIAMLFFAESLVYGILGSVIGYFVAQGSAKAIIATNSFQGLYLNFSSSSAVLSAGLVMAVVLGSTIYPARKAAQIAAPAQADNLFTTEPEGDEWLIQLPFSIGEKEARPLVRFLADWFRAYEEYTIGDFVSSGTRTRSNGEVHEALTTTWLAPYDLGVSQDVVLIARPSNVPGVYQVDFKIHRVGGDPENWITVNRRFMENIRKQFLTWRTLDAVQRKAYETEPEPSAVA